MEKLGLLGAEVSPEEFEQMLAERAAEIARERENDDKKDYESKAEARREARGFRGWSV